MAVIENRNVLEIFQSYPIEFREKLLSLRSLTFEVAKEEGIAPIEETLKWGEPSYVSTIGSPIGIAWRKRSPHTIRYFSIVMPDW